MEWFVRGFVCGFAGVALLTARDIWRGHRRRKREHASKVDLWRRHCAEAQLVTRACHNCGHWTYQGDGLGDCRAADPQRDETGTTPWDHSCEDWKAKDARSEPCQPNG